MKHIAARKRPKETASRSGLIIILLVAVCLSAGFLISSTVDAAASAPLSAVVRPGLEPTPTPAPANNGSSPSTSPVIGIPVLLAPMIFIIWKSRGKKEPKVTASCCAPVIDENKRPFQIYDDQPIPATSEDRE